MKKLILYVFCFVSTQLSLSQNPYSIRISKLNGLVSNAVYDILRDSVGFTWMATNNGLQRYDGNEFITYTNENQSSLAGSSLFEDKFHRIWYQNFDGYLYYVKNDKLHSLIQKNPLDYIAQGITNKHLFYMNQGGIDVYDLKTLKINKHFPLKNPHFVNSTSVDQNFYFIENHSLYKIDENLNLEFLANIHDEKCVWYITKSKSGINLVSRSNLNKSIYLVKNKKIEKFLDFANQDEVFGIQSIGQNLWVLTSNGVYKYDYLDGKYYFDKIVFEGKKVTKIFRDSEGNYWFSTLLDGVFLVPDLNRTITEIPGYNPLRLIKLNNLYLIGTKNHEVIITDTKFNYQRTLTKGNSNSDVYYLYGDPSNKNIFYSSHGSNLIVPNQSGQEIAYNMAIKELSKIDEKYYAFAASGMFGLMKNPASVKNFKSKWDEIFNNYKDIEYNIACLKSGLRARSVCFDSIRNLIYAATNQGLICFDGKQFTELKYKKKSIFIQELEFVKGEIFALSSTGNMYKIVNSNKIELINDNIGFEQNTIKAMFRSNDTLLIRTISRLKIFPNTKNFNHVYFSDINLSNFDVYDILLDGKKINIVTNLGMLSLSLSKINFKNTIPRLNINFVKTQNKIYKNFERLLFNHTQNNIEINFSVLSFGKVWQNNLWYKINNDDWKEISEFERNLKLASLSPNIYKIQFMWKGENEYVFPNELVFSIEAPYYKKAWFLITISLIFLSILFLYFNSRLNILKHKNFLLKEKIELEKNLSKSILTSIKSQMNPHFFYNALNTIQSYIFLNDKKNASSYLSKFSNLTRMILEMSEKESIALTEEIKALTLYLELEKMRFEDGFDFEFVVDSKLEPDINQIPSMLIQPYVENAVKHGLLHKNGYKKIVISFSRFESFLQVTIQDNGIGRKKSYELNKIKRDKHNSFASDANAKRLEILNQGLKINVVLEIIDCYENNQASGTIVKLNIPIK